MSHLLLMIKICQCNEQRSIPYFFRCNCEPGCIVVATELSVVWQFLPVVNAKPSAEASFILCFGLLNLSSSRNSSSLHEKMKSSFRGRWWSDEKEIEKELRKEKGHKCT